MRRRRGIFWFVERYEIVPWWAGLHSYDLARGGAWVTLVPFNIITGMVRTLWIHLLVFPWREYHEFVADQDRLRQERTRTRNERARRLAAANAGHELHTIDKAV